MYGVLSSKLNHTFIKRSSDPKSRHVDFTEVFNSESQVQPSMRLMYLYILDLAGSAARLDPQDRHATADTEKWVPPSRKRAHGPISVRLASDDDHDADDSDNTTGSATDGPAHYTHSQASAAVSKARQAAGSIGTMQPQYKQKEMAGPAKILCQMPQVSRSSLHLADAISFRHACVVWHLPFQAIAQSAGNLYAVLHCQHNEASMLLWHVHVSNAIGRVCCLHEAHLHAYAIPVHAGATWYMAGAFLLCTRCGTLETLWSHC